MKRKRTKISDLRRELAWAEAGGREEAHLRRVLEAEWARVHALYDQAIAAKTQLELVMAVRSIWVPSYVVNVEIDDAIEASLS